MIKALARMAVYAVYLFGWIVLPPLSIIINLRAAFVAAWKDTVADMRGYKHDYWAYRGQKAK